MRILGQSLIALLAWFWLTLAFAQVPNELPIEQGSLQIAITQAPPEASLDDILSGRVLPGITPVLANSVSLPAPTLNHVWLRLKLHLPAYRAGTWHIRLNRQGIEGINAYFPEISKTRVPVLRVLHDQEKRRHFPDSYYVSLPADWKGDKIVYLEIIGAGYLHLEPKLLSRAQAERQDQRGEKIFIATYLTLLFGVAFALARQHVHKGAQMVGTAVWALVLLLASMVFNGHAEVLPGGSYSLAAGPGLGLGLFVMAAGQALWVTRSYAGMNRHVPFLSSIFDKAGWVLLMLGVAVTYLPIGYMGLLQTGVLALWTMTAVACIFGLSMDSRQTRWSAILVWCGLLLAMFAPVLAYWLALPASQPVRIGFQLLLALLVLVHVLVPWIRAMLQARQMQKRKSEPVFTPEQKIDRAREQLMTGLNSALRAASEGDLEWIAFRRLLEGLKPVLPQAASAVIAMNYHNEDLLLVEPKEAKERYAMLLNQRGNLLRNLSRSTAPQQIVIDFDGPDGPLEHVQLALIPLPIEKPGWGALLVERVADQAYSDAELSMCAEFASLATTAGEDAAFAMQERRGAEIDPDVGVYRHDAIDPILRKIHEASLLQRRSLSVLLIALDEYNKLPEVSRLPAMRAVADLVREEAQYGWTLGRMEEDSLLMIVPDLQIGLARELAERICTTARKHSVADLANIRFNVSIGIAQLQQIERSPQQMLLRLAKALAKAREYGGNQVQSTDSAVL